MDIQDIFDLACKGEIEIKISSAFDDDGMPLFTCLVSQGIHTAEVMNSDDAATAINEAVSMMRRIKRVQEVNRSLRKGAK